MNKLSFDNRYHTTVHFPTLVSTRLAASLLPTTTLPFHTNPHQTKIPVLSFGILVRNILSYDWDNNFKIKINAARRNKTMTVIKQIWQCNLRYSYFQIINLFFMEIIFPANVTDIIDKQFCILFTVLYFIALKKSFYKIKKTKFIFGFFDLL